MVLSAFCFFSPSGQNSFPVWGPPSGLQDLICSQRVTRWVSLMLFPLPEIFWASFFFSPPFFYLQFTPPPNPPTRASSVVLPSPPPSYMLSHFFFLSFERQLFPLPQVSVALLFSVTSFYVCAWSSLRNPILFFNGHFLFPTRSVKGQHSPTALSSPGVLMGPLFLVG